VDAAETKKTNIRARDSAIMISGASENPRILNLANMVFLRIG
jgi:hypothetical protein